MIGLVVLAATISTIATYIDKHLVKIGISRKDYFYYMCLSMIPFSIAMIVIEIVNGTFKFELTWISIILLIIAMFIRYKQQHTVVGCLTYLSPYESTAYMCLGIILSFIIDTIIGVKQFSLVAIASIVLTLMGVFILADAKLRIKTLQKDLLIRIILTVTMGYVTHYILNYWSNATFILILNLLLTIIFSKGYTIKTHIENKKIIKWVFVQQTFGFFSTYISNYISTISVMIMSYVKPVEIVLSIIIAIFMKNTEKKPRVIDLFAIFLVSIGVGLIDSI